MGFGESFVTLFTTMEIATALCLICGLILIFIEIFQPGFGIFGISGGVLLLIGVILQAITSNYNLTQIIILIFLLILILFIAFLIMMRSLKYGWLSRSPIIQNETAVPQGLTDGTEDFSFLLGKEGITKTFLRPVGKAEFDGKDYDVVAYQGAAFEEGISVIVCETEGSRIVVKKLQ